MLSKAMVAARIKETGLIAIIRGNYTLDQMMAIANTLSKGGVKAVEITLNSPGALSGINALRKSVGDDLLVGAGTVRTASDTQEAIDAGAQFLISPNFDPASIAVSQQADLLHLPGVFTASEVQTAYAAGCKMVKLFPADMLGPAYVKALRAPLNDVEFVPTGGINPKNIAAYKRAGAVAFGVGSALVQGGNEDIDDLLKRTKKMTQAVAAAWAG